jgi:hypothetical protein
VRPALQPLRGLATALTIVACLSTAVAVLSVALLQLALRQTAGAFESEFALDENGQIVGGTPELGGALATAALGGLLALVWIAGLVATAVLLLVWQARAMRNASVLAGRPMKFATALALVSWFLPVVSWFIPWMNLNDVWRSSRPAHAADRSPNLVLGGWWAAWCGWGLATALASRQSSEGDSPLSSGGLLELVLLLVATGLMVAFVRTITGWQDAEAHARTVPTSRGASAFDLFGGAAPAPPLTGVGVPPTTNPAHAGTDRSLVNATSPVQPPYNPRDPFSWPGPGGNTAAPFERR